MSREFATCRPGDSVAKALDLLLTNGARHLSVLDDAGGVVGLIALADLAFEPDASRVARPGPSQARLVS